ncbi:PIN domain-containing protein [Paraliobacillus salinarum]|uniref:PIN domain-containing protein n=1 Tax=Paraliobacillus salinarum TaxID=1158996 RepID=UPI0015F65EEA|nr:PIN domain-containing protein [Paraliobacillus salinarum]
MIINAKGIIDINNDTPLEQDEFFVDTNVWFWLTYHRANQNGNKYQLTDYPNYIEAALVLGTKLFRSGLSLSELAHQIEKVEREIYKITTNNKGLKPKDYRINQSERAKVVEEVETSWEQVKTFGRPLEHEYINEVTTDLALNKMGKQALDGYDLFLMEFVERAGINKVISDDKDLASVPNIYLFTANKNLISEAESQGKLIVRKI